MHDSERPPESTDYEATEHHLEGDVLLRALLELAESAERNRQQSGSATTEDGPLPEAA
jgi:hypothetical protein